MEEVNPMGIISSLERRVESLTEACQNLEKENEILRKEVRVSHEKLINAQKNVDISKESLMNSIGLLNKTKEDYSKEIDILRSKLDKVEKALE